MYHIMAVCLKSNKNVAVTSNFDTPGTLCPGWTLMLPEQHFDFPAFLSLARTPAGRGKVRSYMFMQFSKAMKKAGPVPESIGSESEPDRNWYEVGSHMMAMCLAEWFDHAGFGKASRESAVVVRIH